MPSDADLFTGSWQPIREITFEVYAEVPHCLLLELRAALPARWTMRLSTGEASHLVRLEGPEDPAVTELILGSQLVQDYALL